MRRADARYVECVSPAKFGLAHDTAECVLKDDVADEAEDEDSVHEDEGRVRAFDDVFDYGCQGYAATRPSFWHSHSKSFTPYRQRMRYFTSHLYLRPVFTEEKSSVKSPSLPGFVRANLALCVRLVLYAVILTIIVLVVGYSVGGAAVDIVDRSANQQKTETREPQMREPQMSIANPPEGGPVSTAPERDKPVVPPPCRYPPPPSTPPLHPPAVSPPPLHPPPASPPPLHPPPPSTPPLLTCDDSCRFGEQDRLSACNDMNCAACTTCIDWDMYPDLNCWEASHGAFDVDANDATMPDVLSIADCKAGCLGDPLCEGFVADRSDPPACFPKYSLVLSDCDQTEGSPEHSFDTYVKRPHLAATHHGSNDKLWQYYPHFKCGGEAVEAVIEVHSLEECKATCLLSPTCKGVELSRSLHPLLCRLLPSVLFSRCIYSYAWDSFEYRPRLQEPLWERREGIICSHGHGATAIDSDKINGGAVPGAHDVANCKTACLRSPACEGFLLYGSGPIRSCFRLASIEVTDCRSSASAEVYFLVPTFGIPAADDHGQGWLTSGRCDAMLREGAHGPFWPMFGSRSDTLSLLRIEGGPTCWAEEGMHDVSALDSFFASALEGSDASRNGGGCSGYLGMMGRWNSEMERWPLLLGPEDALYAFCSTERGYRFPPSMWQEGQHEEVIKECIKAQRIVVNALGNLSWTMCSDFEWQTCAAQGELVSAQLGKGIQFARAPKTLMLEELNTACDDEQCPLGFNPISIFFFDVCFFSHVCDNRFQLFDVNVGEVFSCTFNVSAFWELRSLLM